MNIRIIIFSIFISIYSFTNAQTIKITGTVMDSITGEAVVGASVYTINKKQATTTNQFGFFSFSIYEGNGKDIEISYVGYDKYNLDATSGKFYTIKLIDNSKIDEVVVESKKSNINQNETGVTKMSIKTVKQLPTLFGENDIMRGLQYIPGVQSGGEASCNLNVRGGSPDQNLILLDDVPLYFVGHFGGLFSIFNSEALSGVTFYRGEFPARFGGRLSSVVDVRMKEGNASRFQNFISLSPLLGTITMQGPIINGKSSFILSARRSLISMIKLLQGPEAPSYYFYDINAKINLKLNENNHFYSSFYMGNDVLVLSKNNSKVTTALSNATEKNNLSWGNILGSLRWNHIFKSKIFSNTTLAFTRYHYGDNYSYKLNEIETSRSIDSKVLSDVNDFILKSDFEAGLNDRLTIRFGGQGIVHLFRPSFTSLKQDGQGLVNIDTTYNKKSIKAGEFSLYEENEYKISQKISANIGFRYNAYILNNSQFHSFEPRILFNYRLFKTVALKLSYSKTEQNIHLLSYSGSGIPSDYWVPATKIVAPEKCQQVSVGLVKKMGSLFEATIETYYKEMNNQIAFKEGKSFTVSGNEWESAIETGGKGISKGVEIMFEKLMGKTKGWISYTYAKSSRQFQNLTNGEVFPYKYDRLNTVNIIVTHSFSENINTSIAWVYGSGYPVTLVESRYENPQSANNSSITDEIYNYQAINSSRMRDYHRLDLGINLVKKFKKRERTWSLSIINVYNRKNPFYYFYAVDATIIGATNGELLNTLDMPRTYKMVLKQKSYFPIMPSINYSLKF